jgi:hypothetical protein
VELCDNGGGLSAIEEGRMNVVLSVVSDVPSTNPSLEGIVLTFLRLPRVTGVVETRQERKEASNSDS